MTMADTDEEEPGQDWPSSSSRQTQRRFLLQSIFFLLGVGILMPWNAFISAKQYFESRQCNSHSHVTEKNIESTFAVVNNLASVLCLGFIIAAQWIQDQWQARFHHHHHHQHGVDTTVESPCVTVAATSTALAAESNIIDSNNNTSSGGVCASDRSSGHAFWLVMVPLFMYVVLWIDIPPDMFRTITLVSLIACGISGSLAQAGIVATAGLFDTSIGINPYLAGQSAGGLAVSICNFLVAAMEDPSSFYQLHCNEDNSQNGTFLLALDTLEQDVTGTSRAILDATHHRLVAPRTTNQNSGRDDETCYPYKKQDLAVFSYFMAGSLVLVACL
jgi:hypothetical protein